MSRLRRLHRLPLRGRRLVFDDFSRRKEVLEARRPWVESGDLRFEEDVVDGIENAPEALAQLFTGSNMGKQFVRIH